MSTKRCSDCQQDQTTENFFNNRSRPDGKDTLCKTCRKARSAAYFKAHPQAVRDYTRKSRAKKKGIPLEEYVKGMRKYERKTTPEQKDSAAESSTDTTDRT